MNRAPANPSSLWSGRPPALPVLAALLLAAIALGPATATAAAPPPGGREKARVEFDKAQIQYKVGHFQEALDGYSRAYELYPAPAFLFNIGQCHKNLKNHERAIFFFEGYLREEKNPAKRALAEDLLAESRAALDQEKQAQRAAAAPVSPLPAPVNGAPLDSRPPPPAAPPPAEAASAQAPPLAAAPAEGSAAQPRARRRWWPWVVAGGLVAAAAGGYLYWRSGSTTVDPPSGSLGTIDWR